MKSTRLRMSGSSVAVTALGRIVILAVVSHCAIVATAQGQRPPQKIPTLSISLKPYGFLPSAVTVRAQTVFLAVNNSSGFRSPSFRLNVNGSRLHDVSLVSSQRHWAVVLQLIPGQYVLTEGNHPQWRCTITVTAR